MKIAFYVGAGKNPSWLTEVTSDYKKKLSFWFQTEVILLSSRRWSKEEKTKRVRAETQEITSQLKPDDYVVLCTEEGRGLSTFEMSKKLNGIFLSGKKRLVIIVGGAYGIDESMLKNVDLKLSLSAMTTTHRLALAFIMEQVYRCVTLIKGVQYHNE